MSTTVYTMYEQIESLFLASCFSPDRDKEIETVAMNCCEFHVHSRAYDRWSLALGTTK
jgi:hypothetical protein